MTSLMIPGLTVVAAVIPTAPTGFIAGDFVVRSKPPAAVPRP